MFFDYKNRQIYYIFLYFSVNYIYWMMVKNAKVISYTEALDQLLDSDVRRAKMVENVRRRLTLVWFFFLSYTRHMSDQIVRRLDSVNHINSMVRS